MDMIGRRFPKRTYDVGIAEQHAVTFAAGTTVEGLKPVCCIYSISMQRAYDQVRCGSRGVVLLCLPCPQNLVLFSAVLRVREKRDGREQKGQEAGTHNAAGVCACHKRAVLVIKYLLCAGEEECIRFSV